MPLMTNSQSKRDFSENFGFRKQSSQVGQFFIFINHFFKRKFFFDGFSGLLAEFFSHIRILDQIAYFLRPGPRRSRPGKDSRCDRRPPFPMRRRCRKEPPAAPQPSPPKPHSRRSPRQPKTRRTGPPPPMPAVRLKATRAGAPVRTCRLPRHAAAGSPVAGRLPPGPNAPDNRPAPVRHRPRSDLPAFFRA